MILLYLSYAIECLILLKFLSSWRDSAANYIHLISASFLLVSFVIHIYLNAYFSSVWIHIFSIFFLCYIYLVFIFNNHTGIALVIALIPPVVICFSNLFLLVIVASVWNVGDIISFYKANPVTLHILHTLISIFLLHFISPMLHKITIVFNFKDTVFSSIVLFLFLFMSICFGYTLKYTNCNLYLCLGILSLIILFFLLFFLISRISIKTKTYIKEESELVHLQNEVATYNQVSQAKEELYQLRHDIKHFMSLLNCAEPASSELKMQSQIIMKRIENGLVPIATPSIPITYILNLKREEAIKQGIDFKCYVNFTGKIAMPDDDLLLLLSNILDNSIKHISTIEKQITFTAKEINDNCLFIVTNTFDLQKSVGKKGTKHGYGISTINRIVKQYSGVVNYSSAGTKFTVKVLLGINKSLS